MEVSRLLRKHIRRLRSRVLRNTKQMLFVNFQRCEVQEGLKLFVWLTRMLHLLRSACAHTWRWSKGRGGKTIKSITSKKRVGISSIFEINHDAMRTWRIGNGKVVRSRACEAAEVLKTERIKLPADANIEVDDKCFPPVCLAKLKPGRSVQQVAAAPQGRPRRQRINGVRELSPLQSVCWRASRELEIQRRHEFQRNRCVSINLCIVRVLECFLRAI